MFSWQTFPPVELSFATENLRFYNRFLIATARVGLVSFSLTLATSEYEEKVSRFPIGFIISVERVCSCFQSVLRQRTRAND